MVRCGRYIHPICGKGSFTAGSAYVFKRLAGLQEYIFLPLRYFLGCKEKERMDNSRILAKVASGVIYSCGRALGVGQRNPSS
jgi:hypothetical protein